MSISRTATILPAGYGSSRVRRGNPVCDRVVFHTRGVVNSPAAMSKRRCPPVTKHTPIAGIHRASISVRFILSAGSSDDASSAPENLSLNLGSLKTPFYVVLWYGFNIYFNILNKQTLNAFPCPWLLSTMQLAASGLVMCFLWATGLQPKPKISKTFLQALAVVSFFHSIGHVSACISFSKMAVSFSHVVKSAEPVFSVLLSGPLLGDKYSLSVWLSLIPIVCGCSLSAMKEISFSWSGFNNAMISNLGMVLRGIFSKKVLVDFKAIDGINLFGLISIFSLLYCTPLAIAVESSQWNLAIKSALNSLGTYQFYYLLCAGGLFFHLYNQTAYMVLNQGISPVTFSVGNTMKRVAVVISSVLFFGNPVSLLNWLGSAMAIAGACLYSIAKNQKPRQA